MSAISEILPPEMLPELLPATILNGNKSLDRVKADGVTSESESALVKTSSLEAPDGGAAKVSVTLNGAPLSAGDAALSTDPVQAEKAASKPEAVDTTPAEAIIEGTETDPVEQDLLLKLEELRKEKSRLFALFRNALQKKEEDPKSEQPHPLSQSTLQEPESLQETRHAQDAKRSEAADPSGSVSVSAAAAAIDRLSKDQETEDGRQASASEARTLGRLSDQNHERRPEPLSRQNIKSRRDYERVIDRSKLNLEIPRKPSISSASSNSTSSTPTTSFAPPKRGRSRSPSVDGGGSFNSNNRGSSGPGSFGPSFPSTSYSSSSSSSHAESTLYPNKYPRADYMGSSQQQHNRNPSNSSSNGLPDKPQGRYHTSSQFQQHASSSARSLGADSYHADEGGYSNRSKGSSAGPGSGMNSGNGGGSYRQNGPMSYHSQGPPPPTRIGFGDSGSTSGNSGSNSGGRSGGGGNAVGRGGFYGHGHGHDGPPTAPISMLGPPGRTHMPFNRSMMQMPHSRGLAHGRIGFGNGNSGGGGSGGGRHGGGPPDRSMSSARPGDWPRRRSRA
ncbi:hypothetical protein BGZ72_002301 [Mortierella alpina]|nr:hypothetical protein BGZ72_002301 [Mortierella alpina]